MRKLTVATCLRIVVLLLFLLHPAEMSKMSATVLSGGGYWRQGADDRLGDPPPRCIQEPLVVRDMDRRPLAGHCLSVCKVVHCWEIPAG